MAISEFIKPLPKKTDNAINGLVKKAENLRIDNYKFMAKKREFIITYEKTQTAKKLQNPADSLEKRPIEKQLTPEMKEHMRIQQNEEYLQLLKQDMFYTAQFQNENRPTYIEIGKGKKKQLVPRESQWEYGESNRGEKITEKRIVEMKRIESKPNKKGKTLVSYIPITEEFTRYSWPMWGNSNPHYLNNNKPMSLSNPLFKLNPESGKLEITKLLNQRLTLWQMERMFEVITGVNVGDSVMEILLSSPLVCERLSFFLKYGQGKNKELDNTPNKIVKLDGKRGKDVKQGRKRKSDVIVSMFSGDSRIMFYSARTKKNSESHCKNFTPLANYLVTQEIVTGKNQVKAWFNKLKNEVKKTGKAITTQKWGYTIRFEFA